VNSGRVLVTGGGGQLARAFVEALGGADVFAPAHGELDVTDLAAVRAAFRAQDPAVVIHTAALTDTRRCEEDPTEAFRVNAHGTRNLATLAAASGAVLVLISTNEVFDGRRRRAYREDDDASPVNVYGRSKEAAEREAITICPALYVVRTAWLYGDGPRNFPFRVLQLARQSCRLQMVSDEIATPTSSESCARAVLTLLRARAPYGAYHVTDTGQASRLDYARAVLEEAGLARELVPVRSRDFPTVVRKPARTVLDCSKAISAGASLPPWRDELARFFAGDAGRRLREAALG
jgi:dTDP-4-dehydrorhamnose reductase